MDIIHEILGAGLGTMAGVWFMIGRLRSTLEAIEHTLAVIDKRVTHVEDHINLLNERIVRVETRVDDAQTKPKLLA